MMKKYTLLLWAIAVVLLTSCSHDLTPELGQGEGIVLNLVPSGMDVLTKTTPNSDPERQGDYDGEFNENVLGSSVDIFFFRNGAGFDTPSVYNKRHSVSQRGLVQLPISPAEITTIFGSNIQGTHAKVLVVANFSGEAIDHSRHYTVNELRAMELATADFKTQFPQESFVMISDNNNTENPSPLVDVILANPTSATPASATVRMKRVAAKVTFRLTVADEITVVNVKRDQSGAVTGRTLETWTPQKSSITAYMQYAIKTGTLGGTPQSAPATVPLGTVPDNLPSIFAYSQRPMVATTDQINRTRRPVTGLDNQDPPQPIYGDPVTSPFTVYEVASDKTSNPPTAGPFYTYPVTWTAGAAGEPFIKLIIPWKNGNNIKYYYYKVPFKKAPLESNHWYEMTIDVQILGGEDTDPVPLDATYKVVDWVPGATATATVESARYLSVPKTEWIMYNTDELTIPITSSHDVQILGYNVKSSGTSSGNAFAAADKYTNGQPRAAAWIGSDPSIYNPFTNTLITNNVTTSTTVGTVYATRPNYSANNPAPYNINTAASWFAVEDVTRDHIVLRHALNNNTTETSYDVAPYYIRIRVRHKDDPDNYYRDIIIEQRPAIVIEPNMNSDGTTDNHHGYVWYDNSYNSTTEWKQRSSITGDNNKNPNMYVITTSVLPSTTSYVIGDPRSLTAIRDNQLVNNWSSTSATYVGGGSHRLNNYYKTDDSGVSDMTIAPSFRVASSHGKSSDMSYSDALRRCASYQEDGRPAGRWRLPTRAEVEYITKLSHDSKIPELFTFASSSFDRGYWCANGKIDGVNGVPTYYSGTDGDRWVRCVYDEWFWENTTMVVNGTTKSIATVPNNAFQWGDVPISDIIRTKAIAH